MKSKTALGVFVLCVVSFVFTTLLYGQAANKTQPSYKGRPVTTDLGNPSVPAAMSPAEREKVAQMQKQSQNSSAPTPREKLKRITDLGNPSAPAQMTAEEILRLSLIPTGDAIAQPTSKKKMEVKTDLGDPTKPAPLSEFELRRMREMKKPVPVVPTTKEQGQPTDAEVEKLTRVRTETRHDAEPSKKKVEIKTDRGDPNMPAPLTPAEQKKVEQSKKYEDNK